MAVIAEEVKIVVEAVTGKSVDDLKKTETATEKLIKKFKKLAGPAADKIITTFKKIAGPLVLGAVGVAAIRMGKDFVKAFAIQEQAEARLNATLKSTGYAAGLSATELENLASALQNTTKFGDEAVIGAESLLLTFKDIGKNVFPEALGSILDVSEALGHDLQDTTIMVGKALNDPIQGLASLRRVGIQLTQSQEDMVKSFVAVGDKANAQKVILGELKSQFGGVAEAAADTSSGAMVQFSNVLGDLKESFGESIADGLNPFVKGLTGLITQMVDARRESKLLKDALEVQAAGGTATQEQTLALLKDQEKKLGQIAASYEGLDEAANTAYENAKWQVENYIESLKVQDVFLTQAKDSSNILADAEAENARKTQEAIEGNVQARKAYEQVLYDLKTPEEQRLVEIQAEIDKLVVLKNTAKEMGTDWSGIEDLLVVLLGEKNTLLAAMNTELTTQVDLQAQIRDRVGEKWAMMEQADAAAIAGAETQKQSLQEIADIYAGPLTGAISAFGDLNDTVNQNAISAIDKQIAARKNEGKSTADLEKKKRDLQKQGWRQNKALQMSNTVINTATAVMAALSTPVIGPALAVMAGITGAVQLATIAAQQMPAFATGGSFVTNGPTPIMVGDNASGQERVTIDPLGGSSGGGGNYMLNIDGRQFTAWMQNQLDNNRLRLPRAAIV